MTHVVASAPALRFKSEFQKIPSHDLPAFFAPFGLLLQGLDGLLLGLDLRSAQKRLVSYTSVQLSMS